MSRDAEIDERNESKKAQEMIVRGREGVLPVSIDGVEGDLAGSEGRWWWWWWWRSAYRNCLGTSDTGAARLFPASMSSSTYCARTGMLWYLDLVSQILMTILFYVNSSSISSEDWK